MNKKHLYKIILMSHVFLLGGCNLEVLQCKLFNKNCEVATNNASTPQNNNSVSSNNLTPNNNIGLSLNANQLSDEYKNLTTEQLVEKADLLNKANRLSDAIPLYRKASDNGHMGATELLLNLYLDHDIFKNIPKDEKAKMAMEYLNRLIQNSKGPEVIVYKSILASAYLPSNYNSEIHSLFGQGFENSNLQNTVVNQLSQLLEPNEQTAIKLFSEILPSLNNSEKAQNIKKAIFEIFAKHNEANKNYTEAIKYHLLSQNSSRIEELCRQDKSFIPLLKSEYARLNQSVAPEQRSQSPEYQTLRKVLLNLGEISDKE